MEEEGFEGVGEERIIQHIPLVKSIVGRIIKSLPKYVDFDDLVGYGMLGLVKAGRDFDPGKNVKFSTYAFYRIKGEIIDALRSQDWLPRSLKEKIQRLRLASKQLEDVLGREPDEEELAECLGMDIQEVRSLLFKTGQSEVVSLEEELQDKLFFDNNLKSEYENISEQEELIDILAKAIDNLDERERTVLALYYYEDLNLKEISSVLNLTESRICQLLANAIEILRNRIGNILEEIVS